MFIKIESKGKEYVIHGDWVTNGAKLEFNGVLTHKTSASESETLMPVEFVVPFGFRAKWGIESMEHVIISDTKAWLKANR